MANLLTNAMISINPDFTDGDVRQTPITSSDLMASYLPKLWSDVFQISLIS
jgi:hypothetical protein